jgi:hypothetical protein
MTFDVIESAQAEMRAARPLWREALAYVFEKELVRCGASDSHEFVVHLVCGLHAWLNHELGVHPEIAGDVELIAHRAAELAVDDDHPGPPWNLEAVRSSDHLIGHFAQIIRAVSGPTVQEFAEQRHRRAEATRSS